MAKPLFLFIGLVSCLGIQAQDYLISFALQGQARKPDSVLVENLTQDKDLTLKRDEVLHLVQNLTAVESLGNESQGMHIYPNPANGVGQPGSVSSRIH